MTCADVSLRLNELVDRRLPAEQVTVLEEHLATCGTCRAELTELRELLSRAEALPRSVPPPRDLWPEIQARLADRAPGGRSAGRRAAGTTGRIRWRQAWVMGIAALMLMALSSALTVWWMRHREGPAARFADVQREYTRATEELTQRLTEGPDALSPATRARVERSLRIIDAAIREAESALALDPQNRALEQMLWARYQQRLELLQRAQRVSEQT